MDRGTRIVAGVIVGLLLVAAVGLAAAQLSIELAVRNWSGTAVREFGGDRVLARIKQLECETCDRRERNDATWALAAIGDKRAYPAVARFHTGAHCRDHQRELCHYELQKAVRRLKPE